MEEDQEYSSSCAESDGGRTQKSLIAAEEGE